jgi:hypothetical protein
LNLFLYIIVNAEILKAIPLKSNATRMPASVTANEQFTEGPTFCNKTKKRKKEKV